MAFRPPKKQPEFADLIGILAQSKDTENPLYQTVQEIINRLTQLKLVQNEEIAKIASGEDLTKKFASKFATFITLNNETTGLPNSLRILAGTNILFDTTIPNQLTISSVGGTGSGGYAPMSTGAEPLEIMSDGAGSVLMVGFSE